MKKFLIILVAVLTLAFLAEPGMAESGDRGGHHEREFSSHSRDLKSHGRDFRHHRNHRQPVLIIKDRHEPNPYIALGALALGATLGAVVTNLPAAANRGGNECLYYKDGSLAYCR